jgi:tRNA(His) guanylyltransferase
MARAADSKSLGDRMKEYEDAYRTKLPRRMPVIIRLDGKAFHTWTKGLDLPFDDTFMGMMAATTKYLVDNIQGAVFAYTQSDEISILLRNYDTVTTDPWYDNNIQKMVSVASSLATGRFNQLCNEYLEDPKLAFFDARVFLLPKEEVVNYFVWRQQDATRNSIRAVAHHFLGHQAILGKNNNEVQDMLMAMDVPVNWNDYAIHKKRGYCYNSLSKEVDQHIPIFSASRDYVGLHLEKQDEVSLEDIQTIMDADA